MSSTFTLRIKTGIDSVVVYDREVRGIIYNHIRDAGLNLYDLDGKPASEGEKLLNHAYGVIEHKSTFGIYFDEAYKEEIFKTGTILQVLAKECRKHHLCTIVIE